MNWIYDEFKQTGINFESEGETAEYDDKYKSLRNYDEEVNFIAQSLHLNPESLILEIGTGTGEHAVRLAGKCRNITACDVSKSMLSIAENKAEKSGIRNITFLNTGFLNLEFPENKFDGVITQLALHHLPDFWKSVAINKIARVLKPGGIFYLLDSILSFDAGTYNKTIPEVINFARQRMGDRIADEIIVNIRDEYPTFDWVIENMLIRNGFTVKNKIRYTDVMSLFISEKITG